MGLGPGSYDFNEVGERAHLRPVDWRNPDHKRIVAACLVEGSECSFMTKMTPSMEPFTGLNILPTCLQKLQNVIAFRGTVLKPESFKEDVKLNIQILHQRFHKKKRTIKATGEVESVLKDNPGPVWLAGHSLGSALAIQAGKKEAEKGVFLETFLFNPPYPSLGPEIIGDKEIRNWFQKKKRKLKIKLANRIKGYKQIHEDIVKFAKLSEWSPHVFVNQNDRICSGYIGYFKQRKMSSLEINSIEFEWVLDAMYSTRALFKDAVKRAFKKKSDYEPFYLFPCASLTINTGDGDEERESHEIRQWWMEDFQPKKTPYSFDLSKLLKALGEQVISRHHLLRSSQSLVAMGAFRK
ncbi:hypothetical protein MRB53_035664 [Persea americana]|uniref:Uncharacterized protein n=1 Tax=Persea americana TaxID=3435 RepID=A0ACC2K5S1_PERAE|nr:hypothetical protein MRB53_035664 [Persea americana]